MYKKICISNRKLVKEDFLKRIEKILASDADMLILREKDLTESEYTLLAEKVYELSDKYNKEFIAHSFIESAKIIKAKNIHLSMSAFRAMKAKDRSYFEKIGVSTHSVEEALEAYRLGASYITASHIFPTACKEGLSPRGLDYLKAVVNAVDIDVYALGGINESNIRSCIDAGAAGICMMSEYMTGEIK